jgi:hypothetical protein
MTLRLAAPGSRRFCIVPIVRINMLTISADHNGHLVVKADLT